MVGPSYACFVDFKRAFDNVWHQGLLYKLKAERKKNHNPFKLNGRSLILIESAKYLEYYNFYMYKINNLF